MSLTINAYSQSAPTKKFDIYLSDSIVFRLCQLVSNYDNKAATIDTTSDNPDALYGRIGKSILCIHNCGSIYVFKESSASSSVQPTYFSDNCFGQFDLAKKSVAVNKEYVFILSDAGSSNTKTSVKLLLINMRDASVKTIDKGNIEPNIVYFDTASSLFYTKNKVSMRFQIGRKKPSKIGF